MAGRDVYGRNAIYVAVSRDACYVFDASIEGPGVIDGFRGAGDVVVGAESVGRAVVDAFFEGPAGRRSNAGSGTASEEDEAE